MDLDHLHALADSLRLAQGADDLAGANYSLTEAAILHGSNAYHRAAEWVLSLHRYELFWQEHGRAPREKTSARSTLDPDERHLGEWARYQRRHRHRLNSYQLARLEVSPAFEWDPREAEWQRMFDATRGHARTHGELPRLNRDDPTEFALARWLGRQLRLLQRGALTDSRGERMHELLRRNWGPRNPR